MAERLDVGTEAKEEKTFSVAGCQFPLSCLFTPEDTERALTTKPLPGDIFLSSYPKCDSKCIDSIIWKLLYMDLKPPPHCFLTNRFLPCIEMNTYDDLSPINEYIIGHKFPRLYKTYLPFKLIPFYKRAKYIYVIRTPWEVCSSYYTFLKLMNCVNDPFDVFVKDFIHGNVAYGSYFKHIMPWNKRINESNILILCREHVEHNPRSAIFTIAAFLGDEYLTRLMDNREIEVNTLNATNWDKPKDTNSLVKSCLAHSHPIRDIRSTSNQLEDVKVKMYTKPSCNEAQLNEIIVKISEKFNETSLEFLWLNLLKKQTPSLFA